MFRNNLFCTEFYQKRCPNFTKVENNFVTIQALGAEALSFDVIIIVLDGLVLELYDQGNIYFC